MSLFQRDNFTTRSFAAAWVLLVAGITLCLGTVASSQAAAPAAYGQEQDVYTTASGMAIHGQVLYMTWPSDTRAERRQVVAVDISHPEKPAVLSSLQFDGYPQGLAVSGSHVLMVNGLDLYIIDATHPQAMKVAGGIRLTSNPLDGPCAIEVQGQTAFLACRRAGVVAVDISNLNQPRVSGRLALPGITRDVAFVSQDLLYTTSDTYGLQVVQTSQDQDKTQFKLITRLKAAKGSPARLAMDGSTLYAASGSIVLADVSLANPQQPQWLAMTAERGAYNPYYGSYAHDLAIVHDTSTSARPKTFALVADGEAGLSVVDVTNPQTPTYLPRPAVQGTSSQSILAVGIRTQGRWALVVDQNYGLRVFDITHPANPTPVGDGLDLTSLAKAAPPAK